MKEPKNQKQKQILLKLHEKDNFPNSWKSLSMYEMGVWIHQLMNRAQMRNNKEKALEDIKEARVYVVMLEDIIQEIEEYIVRRFKEMEETQKPKTEEENKNE